MSPCCKLRNTCHKFRNCVILCGAPSGLPDARGGCPQKRGTAHACVRERLPLGDRRRFVVTAFRLPPAPTGRTYQLWAIAEGHGPVSMGTFNTDASGVATVTLPVGAEIEALGFIKACGITQEPSGGSSAPTETPRFAGEWRHTD